MFVLVLCWWLRSCRLDPPPFGDVLEFLELPLCDRQSPWMSQCGHNLVDTNLTMLSKAGFVRKCICLFDDTTFWSCNQLSLAVPPYKEISSGCPKYHPQMCVVIRCSQLLTVVTLGYQLLPVISCCQLPSVLSSVTTQPAISSCPLSSPVVTGRQLQSTFPPARYLSF